MLGAFLLYIFYLVRNLLVTCTSNKLYKPAGLDVYFSILSKYAVTPYICHSYHHVDRGQNR